MLGSHEEVDLEAFTDEMGQEWTEWTFRPLFVEHNLHRFYFRSVYSSFFVFFLFCATLSALDLRIYIHMYIYICILYIIYIYIHIVYYIYILYMPCHDFPSRFEGFRRDTLSSRHTKQLGTLGGGNHFVELVYDEEDSEKSVPGAMKNH